MTAAPYPVITLPHTWKPGKPRGYAPLGIVWHSMGEKVIDDDGKVWDAADWLVHIGCSVHATIAPDGTIMLCVRWEDAANHAGGKGKSKFKQWDGLNWPFLGIEFLIAGEHTYLTHRKAIAKPEAFTEAQYQAGAWLGRHLMELFPSIPLEHNVRHSDVSGPDVRTDFKVDPGSGFDWLRFKQMLAHG